MVLFICLLVSVLRNIQENLFSGIIPQHFQSIPNLWLVVLSNKSSAEEAGGDVLFFRLCNDT